MNLPLTNHPAQKELPGSLFSQPWWLDAVAPGEWDEVRVEKGGKLFARMPFVKKKFLKFTYLAMPPLTQTLGPWLRPHPGKYTSRLAEEKKLMNALIDQLPPFDIFIQHFHYSLRNWLPFYWRGFEQTTRYTYVIEDLKNPERILEGMKKSTRAEIKSASNKFQIQDDLNIDDFLDLNEKTFQRQGRPLPYSRELVKRLDTACEQRTCRKIFSAKDKTGILHAAIYIVWDEESAYYLMGAAEPELRNSGATSLLLWESIKFSADITKTFNFEGSVVENIEKFFRSFGATQKTYFQVTKTNSLMLKIAQDLREWKKIWRER